MNQFQSDIQPITNPTQALSEFLGEQLVHWLLDYSELQLNSWPELKRIRQGARSEKLRKFLLQKYLAEQAFWGFKAQDPGFLGFAIANLSESDDPAAEQALELLEGKKEQTTAGDELSNDNQKQLWLTLLKGLGVKEEELERVEPKRPTRNFIADLSDLYSNSEWQEVLAAFCVKEKSLLVEYKCLIDLLKHSAVAESEQEIITQLYALHQKFLVELAKVLEKAALNPEAKQLMWAGLNKELAVKKGLYQGLVKYLLD